MIISIIAALSQNRVIGKDNNIPWSLPDDMKYFKRITATRDNDQIAGYNHVIMGRKNWDSIPEKYRPLPNRINWVITRDRKAFLNRYLLPISNTHVTESLPAAVESIAMSEPDTEVFIIGGGEIYAEALPVTRRMYLTEIKAEIEGDIFFPEVDMSQWKEISRTSHGIDEKHAYEFDFVIYERI